MYTDSSADAVGYVVAIVVGGLYLIFHGFRSRAQRQYELKRSEALRSVALSLGMSFEDGRDIDATLRTV